LDIRDFTKEGYAARRAFVETLAMSFNDLHGSGTVRADFKEMYRNAAESLKLNGYPIDLALDAMNALGIVPRMISMRGGYDGAVLSEKGLPCPNLFCGAHNFHSVFEFLPVSSLKKASAMVVEIVTRAAAANREPQEPLQPDPM
jgi:tripeptide aminopeptidase